MMSGYWGSYLVGQPSESQTPSTLHHASSRFVTLHFQYFQAR